MRNYQRSTSYVFSLLLWPIIALMSTFFTYSPFDISLLEPLGISTNSELIIFLVTGTLAYTCFWAMLEGAIHLGKERENGTLEITFLSPANKTAVLYGRAFGGIIQSLFLLFVFTIILLIVNAELNIRHLYLIPIAMAILVFTGAVWGVFINAIFLLSRDIDVLFTISDEPMLNFSGVRSPISTYPLWFRAIAAIFPLTHCIEIIRAIFFNTTNLLNVRSIISYIVIVIVMITITHFILRYAIKKNRETGDLQLY